MSPTHVDFSRAIALVVSVVGSGCELTAELGAYSLADGETTVLETSGEGSGDHSGETSTGGGTEAGDAGSEDGDGDPGDGDPGDGDPGDGQCTIDGSEDACLTCTKFLCCDRLSACDSEFGCNCMVQCLSQSEPVTCAMTCSPGAAYFMLLQCQVTSCAAVCG